MSSAALEREYLDALSRTTASELAPLREAGVGEPGFAIAPAVTAIRISGGRFEVDPDSDATAFVLPIRVYHPLSPEAPDPARVVREGEIVDLLAFSATYPNRWATRFGTATWLGAVEPQYLMPAPVPVWRNPLHWLVSDCQGLVLLSRDRRERYRVLTCLDTIIAEDDAHAEELRELLQHPWLAPPVLVRRGREVRNAA